MSACPGCKCGLGCCRLCCIAQRIITLQRGVPARGEQAGVRRVKPAAALDNMAAARLASGAEP